MFLYNYYRLGWRAPNGSGGAFESRPFRSLEPEEYQKWTELRKPIDELKNTIVDYLCIERDFDTLWLLRSELPKTVQRAFASKPPSPTLMLIETDMWVQRAASNFIGSAGTFRDRYQKRCTRFYGEDSAEKDAFKKSCSREFDNNFSYRLMYNLRNYAFHQDVPIQNLEIIQNGVLNREPNIILDLAGDSNRWSQQTSTPNFAQR